MAEAKRFDLIVIGSGPGGYVAAVRAAQLGMKTLCVESEERLGGVCLNVGCIPSKALLDSSEFFHMASDKFAEHGIKTGKVSLDLAKMMARKDKVVEELTGNVRMLLDGNGIEVVHGRGALTGPNTVAVTAGDKTVDYSATFVLLATGSEPVSIPNVTIDEKRIVSSTGALRFDKVPKHLGIIGGGYIGLELGSVWQRLGAKVTVVEMLPKIAGSLDGQVGRTLDRILKKQGMEIRVNTKVTGVETTARTVKLTLEAGDKEETLSVDRLLVAVGRRPLTSDLGLEAAGVDLDEASGRISVDAACRTNIETIYAIGDLIPGPMLAHKASAEGIVAVEAMAGKASEVNYDAIPSIIYTWPEVASVGLTEEQVKERNIPYCVGTFPFTGAGRARCMGETDGFVKLLSHSRTDRILGVHIIGPRAADMIAECVLAVEFGASAEDIARTIHGHPTFSEALMEAAMGVRKCSIYGA